jgi:glycosyltransferase involved in cell wall biosynthesis
MAQRPTAERPLGVTLVGLVAAGYGGVPRYARTLARALDGVAREFEGLDFTLLTNPAGAAAIAPQHLRMRVAGRREAGFARLASEQVAAARAKADVLHFFDLLAPMLAPRRPFTATVHDAVVAHDYRIAPARRAYTRAVYPWAARRARALVAVSAFAKDEAVRYFGADPGRVHVIRSGPGLMEPGTDEASLEPPDAPFLVYVGGLAPNKGLVHLVRAFDRVNVDGRLVLAGRPAHGFEEIERAVAAARAPDRIRIVTDANDADADRLYRQAVALAHPSEYEGFGFTPLEAMARGCPVLASDIPAIREISGAGALLLPPGDEHAWTEAIVRVFADPSLRDSLRERGLRTVASYSWERTARELCELLLEVGRRRGKLAREEPHVSPDDGQAR